MVRIVILSNENSDQTSGACFSAMNPSLHRHGFSTEPSLAESDPSRDASLFGDPDPEIFLAAIPFLGPNIHSRSQYVEH
jgi:hypothetical protein